MKKVSANYVLILFLACSLPAFSLMSCNPEELPSASQPPGAVTISGRVLLALPPNTPIADATVDLVGGSMSTTSGADGSWSLENVPTSPDPILKVTKRRYAPSYNTFPISANILQYDLQAMDSLTYSLLGITLLGDDLSGVVPQKVCLVMGAVVGFVSMEYPQKVQPLADATIDVTVTPVAPGIRFSYFNAQGPDPTLTKTDGSGAFGMVVKDATITGISIAGTKPGTSLVAPAVQPFPAAFVVVGLIDPFYVPPQ